MNFSIIEKKEEPLFFRIKLIANIEFEGATPSYPQLRSLISTHTKTEENLVVIRHIYTSFGRKNATVTAYVYADESKKQLIEPKLKEKKEKKAKELKK